MAAEIIVCDDQEFALVEARCCRSWEVALLNPIGKCGYCGEKPEVVLAP